MTLDFIQNLKSSVEVRLAKCKFTKNEIFAVNFF